MKTNEAIKLAVNGNAAEIAKAIGRHPNLVYRWTLPIDDYSDSGALSDLDRLIALMEKSLTLGTEPVKALAPIYCQAHHFGGIFLPPVPHTCENVDISKQLARAMKEAGEAFAVAAGALEDDNVSPNDRKLILKEAYEAMHELSALTRLIENGKEG